MLSVEGDADAAVKAKAKEDMVRDCAKNYQARKLSRDDAMVHGSWRKLMKDG